MSKVLEILGYIPALIKAVMAVEAAVPITGQGKTKLDMIISIMQAADDSITSIIPILQKAISAIVTAFNAMGIFKTTAGK